MTDIMVVLSTFPSHEVALKIADVLVEERLAACVNLVQGVTSVYRWQGGVAREAEILGMIKTKRDRFDALAARLRTLHPYELPEIVALDASAASQPYLDWVRGETTPLR